MKDESKINCGVMNRAENDAVEGINSHRGTGVKFDEDVGKVAVHLVIIVIFIYILRIEKLLACHQVVDLTSEIIVTF